MKKIIQKHPYLMITISAIAGALIVMIASGIFFFSVLNPKRDDMSRVTSVYNQIDSEYYKNVDSSKLADGAINGMLSTLNDPFSSYLTDSDATSLNDSVSGSFGGIGIQVVQKDDEIEVMSTIEGPPAQKAHLKAGDVILAVDGTSLSNKPLSKAMTLMRGKVGTKVKVKLRRGNTTFEKTITRAKIPVETVTHEMLKNKVGYISISTVAEHTANDLKKALKQLDKKGAKSYIIDVRNNPGGLMDQALKMSSMFLKDGKTIMQVKKRDQKAEIYKAGSKYDDGYKVKKPVVVMINGESASAAEIFAAALNQSANIKLVGSKSYGKGTVQNITQYTATDELKLTIAKWLTPNGTWIHKKGLKPDYQADYPAMAYITSFNEKNTYEIGDSNTDIKNLQIALHDLNYYQKTPSKKYSTAFAAAVKKYQQENKLSATGKVDVKTMRSIEEKIIDELQKNDPALNKAEQVIEKE